MSEEKHPGGRPSKLTPETMDRLCQALQRGASHEHAAAYAGISPATFYRWKALGEGADPTDSELADFAEFLETVKKAEACGAFELLGAIRDAAGGEAEEGEGGAPRGRAQWQAGAWILERRWPEMYGKREKVEHSGPGGGPIPIANMTREERQKRIAELAPKVAKVPGADGG